MLKNFRKADTVLLTRNDFYPFFPAVDSTQLFNMQVDFRKNHFSGIVVIKWMEADVYRIVFTTHFGMSVFDFEFNRGVFQVNHCLEVLNKKSVIRLLENDFRVLLFLNLKDEDNFSYIYKDKDNPFREINKTKNFFYLKDTEKKALLEIEAPHFFSSLHYDFADYQNRFPSRIGIKHRNIGLRMLLEKI